jgi:hypothetical protein
MFWSFAAILPGISGLNSGISKSQGSVNQRGTYDREPSIAFLSELEDLQAGG